MSSDDDVLDALCSVWMTSEAVSMAAHMSRELTRHHLNKLFRQGRAERRKVDHPRSGWCYEWRLGDGREEQA